MTNKRSSDSVTFTFGRFNPPTTGHKKLIDAVKNHAQSEHGDHVIFPSHSHDSKKNPLSHAQKVGFLKKMFPNTNIHSGTNVKTALDAVKHLHKSGYKKVTMLVGDDRQKEFHNLLHRYNGVDYHVPDLKVKSAGQRDPDSEGVEGMSASKMRDFASKRKFSEFKKGVPHPAYAKELYHAVRKGMKLENVSSYNKALFIVGVPGSGKDVLINSIIESTSLIEIPLSKLVHVIYNNQDIDDINERRSIIINGTAESVDDIVLTKNILESLDYETGMLYVYTTNEESKHRNDERLSKGLKTISEEVRSSKYEKAVSNLLTYSDHIFDNFYLFDNGFDFDVLNESKQNEVYGWLQELGVQLGTFFNENYSLAANDNSRGNINAPASSSPTENDATIISKSRKTTKSGAIRPIRSKPTGPIINQSGSGRSDVNMSEVPAVEGRSLESLRKKAKDITAAAADSAQASPETMPLTLRAEEKKGEVQQGSIVQKPKKPLTKPAKSPPDFFDGRIGNVPSGSMGLTSSYQPPKKKIFLELRTNIKARISNIDGE